MNFDLALIPSEKFVIDRSNEKSHIQPVKATTGFRCRFDAPEDEQLLKFDPFFQEELIKTTDNIGAASERPDELFDEELGERDRSGSNLSIEAALTSLVQIKDAPKKKCGKDSEFNIDLDWLLSSISPPQECYVENKRYIRRVSRSPADSCESYDLELKLDKLLQERHANPTGCCTIRRGLYGDCFNEVIRQIAVSGSRERAVLFLRYREDLQSTIKAYQTMQESTASYCTFLESKMVLMRKQSPIPNINVDMERLKAEHRQLVFDLVDSGADQNRELDRTNRKHRDELEYLKVMNTRLRNTYVEFTSVRSVMNKKGDGDKEEKKDAASSARNLLRVATKLAAGNQNKTVRNVGSGGN